MSINWRTFSIRCCKSETLRISLHTQALTFMWNRYSSCPLSLPFECLTLLKWAITASTLGAFEGASLFAQTYMWLGKKEGKEVENLGNKLWWLDFNIQALLYNCKLPCYLFAWKRPKGDIWSKIRQMGVIRYEVSNLLTYNRDIIDISHFSHFIHN